MSPARALVVGGTGFLGRHVVDALIGAGWDVLRTSRRPGPRTAVIDYPRRRIALADTLVAYRPDVVVNAAGLIWRDDLPAMRQANIEVPRDLVLAMADAGGRARLVHLGSCLEYGPVPHGVAIDEQVPAVPSTTYGRTKLAAFECVSALAGVHGLDVVALRVFNAIGPGMSQASVFGGVVGTLLAAHRARTEAVLRLFDLGQFRDYVDARDVADAVVAAGSADVPTGVSVFNVGSSTARTAVEIAAGLARASGVEYRIDLLPAPDGASRALGADWQLADTTLAGAVLGWTATRSLPDTLRHIWTCALTQEGGSNV